MSMTDVAVIADRSVEATNQDAGGHGGDLGSGAVELQEPPYDPFAWRVASPHLEGIVGVVGEDPLNGPVQDSRHRFGHSVRWDRMAQ
jgi:hypothetical protein